NYILNLLSTIKLKNIQALLLFDFILLPLALFTSVLLRLGGVWDHKLDNHLWLFLALPLWTIPIFIYFGLYKAVIKYFDEKVVLIVFSGVSLSVIMLILCVYFFHIYSFPKTSIIIYWVFALAYIGGTRFIMRGIQNKMHNANKSNVAIYGAGSAGIQTCVALLNSYEYNPVVLLDDDRNKWGKTIRGITVYSPKMLTTLIKKYNIAQVLIAIPSLSNSKKIEIINQIEPLSIKVKTLPGLNDLISGEITTNDIKEVEVEDLLGREPIAPDMKLMHKNIFGENVMVTGAGGSIGSELVRQIAKLEPKLLILFDVSEYLLYLIDKEINNKFPQLKIVSILGSVTDESLINLIIKTYEVNTIYHAAAYKHVPMVEFNPIIGIKNNSIGTYIVAKAALKHNVNTVVLISTDKAVRATNIMGASKRLAEMILQAFNSISDHTIFTMVRFGNVLGSSGSVVPLFKEQIKAGGPITVTHPKIIRYFMTIHEAVQLVIQASNMANGGEVFVLDMGNPVKILDLATRMINLSGYNVSDEFNPNGDIEITFSGLRPGEKLYEELLIGNNPEATANPRIMKANEEFVNYSILHDKITSLIQELNLNNLDNSINILKELVKDYKILSPSEYE
ncbi:MAG: nucleoside-diphosphate sugar epimerase/dehydratase, partial [Burkholderiales bacterium]|nr:nucleoside-diphosphate sugar epimerase/dehydratase [Burkholderiales bacterium]